MIFRCQETGRVYHISLMDLKTLKEGIAYDDKIVPYKYNGFHEWIDGLKPGDPDWVNRKKILRA